MIDTSKKKIYFLVSSFYTVVDFLEVSFGSCYRLKFCIRTLEINALNLTKVVLSHLGLHFALESILHSIFKGRWGHELIALTFFNSVSAFAFLSQERSKQIQT